MNTTLTEEDRLRLFAIAQWTLHGVKLEKMTITEQLQKARDYALHGCDCGCGTNYPSYLAFPDAESRCKVLEDGIINRDLVVMSSQFFDSIEETIGPCPMPTDMAEGVDQTLGVDDEEWIQQFRAWIEAFIHMLKHWSGNIRRTRKSMERCTCLAGYKKSLGSDVFDKLMVILEDTLGAVSTV